MSLSWTHLFDSDAAAWAELTQITSEKDGDGQARTEENRLDSLRSSSLDPQTDTWAVWDAGRLVAVGTIEVGEALWYDGQATAVVHCWVHPEWRGQGIGTELLRKAEIRAKEALDLRFPADPHTLTTYSNIGDDPAVPVLKAAGFESARSFHDMERSVSKEEVFPEQSHAFEGLTIRAPEESDYEELRDAHNEAFSTHWGSAPMTEVEFREMTRGSSARPSLSRIAATAEGRILAYVWLGEYVEGVPYIDAVGTRAEARGKGLAKATINEVLRGVQGLNGVERVGLDVDATNPSGAVSLYESLGFKKTNTLAAFQKKL